MYDVCIHLTLYCRDTININHVFKRCDLKEVYVQTPTNKRAKIKYYHACQLNRNTLTD